MIQDFFITQLVKQYELACASASQAIRRAEDMWQVRRAADVQAPALIRGVLDHDPKRQLAAAAARRFREILDQQLKQAAEINDLSARKAFLDRIAQEQWIAMRGEYAQMYRLADSRAAALLRHPLCGD